MNIGQKINEFDNLSEGTNTVDKFNEMFGTDVEGSGLLEIGEITTGGLREVIVNGVTKIISIYKKDIEQEEIEDDGLEDSYSIIIDGSEVAKFANLKSVAIALETNLSLVSRYCKKNWEYYGYQIKLIRIPREEREKLLTQEIKILPKNLKRVRKHNSGQGRKSYFDYRITLANGLTKTFPSKIEAAKFIGKSRKAVGYRVRKKIDYMLSGWQVEEIKEKIGE